ncbi:MAG TPA: DUF4350 domain-containing protein [Gemmatimonadales bacterium]|nr:DUF4350 domain-containing protein [Gemmatimonadales bacterium]
MQSRREVLVAAGAMLLAATLVAVLGVRSNRRPSDDPRRSTYLSGPNGARGMAQALGRLGVRVVQLRQNPAWHLQEAAVRPGAVLAVLGPQYPLTPSEGIALATLPHGVSAPDLLLAGIETNAAMRCFGWRAERRSSRGAAWVQGQTRSLDVEAVLMQTRRRVIRDSSGAADGVTTECRVPDVSREEMLLVAGNGTAAGAAAAVRLTVTGGRTITLVADDELFSNRALRDDGTGPFVLRLVAGRYDRMLVDEYHQGFGPSGSLWRAALGWSSESPWGWALWQLAAVGLIALAAASRRFGPVRGGIDRRRRSPLEHVRALATALAAARGHDLAVRLLVQGLRRRIAAGAPPGAARSLRADPRPWLSTAEARARTARGRSAAQELTALLDHPQSAAGVLRAADLAEDLWTDLTPR